MISGGLLLRDWTLDLGPMVDRLLRDLRGHMIQLPCFLHLTKLSHQAQLHGCVTCAVAQASAFRKASHVVLMLYCHHLEIHTF